ncbi:MAG TPA: glycoside hydrolase family 15 protein [Arachidicoccus sp.]|nr:glycoside hydrolase family 15 protein [Arachidicoccus sp.]
MQEEEKTTHTKEKTNTGKSDRKSAKTADNTKKRHTYPFGIVGNCSYLAHIKTDTNICWLCMPRFDSSFLFGGLLDTEKGGEFSVLPEGTFTSTQYYIENTNILCTEINYADGSYRVTDLAPRFNLYDRYFKPLMLIRKIEPLSGTPSVKITCKPVTEYGNRKLDAYPASNHIDFFGAGNPVRLTTDFSINHILAEEFTVLNDTKYLVLTYGSPLEAPLASTVEDFLHKTQQYWGQWVKKTSIGNMYQKQVIRSALVLKIHQYEDTGAIIAASTTSLPEAPGSGRNWDYRFCWLRDAYYILLAFNNIGHFEEMERYFNYIANISVKEKGRFQPLYGIAGEKNLKERILGLSGYMNNVPVRVGNEAATHIQNDIYGQVLLSLLPLYTDERFVFREKSDSSAWIASLLKKIEMVMDEPDAGLWEFRNKRNYHCYTYLFHWAGCQAAIKISERIKDHKIRKWAERLKQKAIDHIESCYDKDNLVYRQAVDSSYLDASTLQLIMMHYLDPDSQKAKDHLKAVEAKLAAPGGLFYRYLHKDDFGYPETTFLITAFWHVEALAAVGRVDEAIEKFEKLLGYGNHLGLFSEDVDAVNGSQWGNFPQAYSHVGLMNAAYRIAQKINLPNFF